VALGEDFTLQQTLDLAEAEGVVLGHRQGRVTARGTSETLTLAIHNNEAELVRYLGGTPYSDPLDQRFLPPWWPSSSRWRRLR